MSQKSVEQLVTGLNMQPHPEGGYYSETYRAADQVTRLSDGAVRSSSTAIYYLLNNGAYSAWHRIASDEVWHFYAGDPLLLHVLAGDGDLQTHRLGHPLAHAQAVCQAVVPAGSWFAAQLEQPAGFALLGCTVAPGFEFSEFELAKADDLLMQYPQHAEIIQPLLAHGGAQA
ncbi:cupin domain-containing protein [Pusillimonas sp. DMV24BSW_D]|uniref:cupin domain-containing protein n=1 Tax=Neopusillimonas aestuarii TaxID=2716226 RepID=UPI001408E84D|nr:cupin domain-containing protein [Pusillimonas sp. DMV24BSW_D]QIM49574.1 cupin domain-containing protein [Pusillimonas sp. DMV24BSW_D]